ncbi:MAG: Glutathionyl-hydroquinone reductase PcpF [Candidatus Celerinatantimonas neptuna]|nr:MAG: Glutathionyl-hydroquinone reductase PcpF [Candidatus Celerinatantimonas neptuna]
MLVNGQWQKNWDPVQKSDEKGRFIRQTSSFRTRLSKHEAKALADGEKPLTLYAGLICPWATRTLIARSLFGLERYLPVKIVAPIITDYGWQFTDYSDSTPRSEVQFDYAHQLYVKSDEKFTGRATIPFLWDDTEQRIINNESADILQIFNDDLRVIHNSHYQLRPQQHLDEIGTLNKAIYERLNNGVYQAGFAITEEAYQEAYEHVFSMLDELENRLEGQRYLFGENLSETDIRLFVTLVRFDVAYYGIFKTNKKRISDYCNLSRYLDSLLQIEAFAKNTNIKHIKAGYYSIKALNPNQIAPKGPELDWFKYL